MAAVFDDILKEVGEFSRFQKTQWVLLFLALLPQSWYCYAPAFTAAEVKDVNVKCRPFNVTNGCQQNCTKFRYSVDYTSIATEWDIVCGRHTFTIPLTKSVFYFGEFCGASFFGWLSDRYGRRFVFFITAFIQLVCSLATTFSINYYMYLFLRFPIGVCSGGNFMSVFVLATEMVGVNYRHWASALTQSSYGMGIAMQALFAYVVREWRYFNLLITLPNLFLVLYWWWVPESARWLTARGRTKEANVILHHMAKCNKQTFDEPQQTDDDDDLANPPKTVKTYYMWDLFKIKYLRMVSCIEGFSWFVTTTVYFGLGFNASSLAGNFYVNFALSGLVEIPAYIIAPVITNRVGRRIPLVIYYVTGGIVLLCILPIVLTGKNKELEHLFLAFSLIGKFAISASFYQVFIHAAELYPTAIRNNGLGFAAGCSRIGGICMPFIVDGTPIAFPYVMFGIGSIIAGILTFFLPETLNKPLPELDTENLNVVSAAKDKVELIQEMNDEFIQVTTTI